MGIPWTFCGALLIAIGTILMCVGNIKSSQKYQKEISVLITQQAALIKVNQAEMTKEIVTKESDLRLIIQNLSKIEKWHLLICVRDPATLFKDGASHRMLMDEVKETDMRFIKTENLLQSAMAPMDSLVRKGLILWNNEDAVVTVTPLGAQVIEVLLRDKIYPFDFDHKYLRKQR